MGMEVINTSMRKLNWIKIKVSESLLKQLDNALIRLNDMRNERYQLVTHLFGKMYVANIGDVVIFRAGTNTRPSRITAIAVDQYDDGKIFVLDNADDIYSCCDYLEIMEQHERQNFFDFVTPRSRQ